MLEKKKLEEISSLAAANISSVLSSLFNSPIQVKINKTEVAKSLVSPQIFEPDSIVTAVKLAITGDIKGTSLVMFLQPTAFILSDLLLKKEHGAKGEMDEKGKAALKEVGNIVTGSYLTVISDTLNANVTAGVPQISTIKYNDILNHIIKKTIREYGMVLFVEIELIFEPTKVNGYMLILLEAKKIISRFQDRQLSPRGEMKKILIADDSSFMRDTLKEILSKEYQIVEADSGQKTIRQFKKEKPDLVLLDIIMPGEREEGVRVLKEIRKVNPEASVVMISAAGHKLMIEKCKNLGAKDYIIKAFSAERIVNTVKKCIG